LILTTNPRNANLTVGACRAIRCRFSLGARVIVLARFRTITRIGIVAFGVARRWALVVAGEVAIAFATVTTDHIPIVASFQVFDFAIVVASNRGAPSHSASTHSSGSAVASFAPGSIGRDGNLITAAASRKKSRCSKSNDRHDGREPA